MPIRILILAILSSAAAYGQSVVSARSGLINFAEGEVFIGDLPVEQKLGKFPEVREGAELRTDVGRAELLLTPGIVLRLGPDSSIRMISGSLIDTRVEFRRGSATIDVAEDPSETQARILYRNYEMRFPRKGSFRIDSTPREFRVYEGQADVYYLGDKASLEKGQMVALYGGLMAENMPRTLTDGLDEWSMRRTDKLAAENPPPGDLNGGGFDPALIANPFYGLSSYTPPVVLNSFGYGPGYGYGYGYGSIYNPGFGIEYQPFPSFVYMPFRPLPGSPSYRSPTRSSFIGAPRSSPSMVYRPPSLTMGRPISGGHPVSAGRAR